MNGLKFVSLVGAALTVTSLTFVACQSRKNNEKPVATVENVPYTNGAWAADPKWIYKGPLKKLDPVKIVISQKSYTARVSGFLPDGFDLATLPDYAVLDKIDGRNRITVVYPIAAGNMNDPSAVNASPGTYKGLTAYPFNRYGAGGAGTPWGGFPFMSYVGNIAFHGPITPSNNGVDWHLRRGPVSHGCNRMQGEHVVELAQLIGVDMTVPHGDEDVYYPKAQVTVTDQYDRLGDGQFKGKIVDVDYPTVHNDPEVDPGGRDGIDQVKRPPAEESHIFKTWNAKVTGYVCEYGNSNCKGTSFPPERTRGYGKSNAKICGTDVNLRTEYKNGSKRDIHPDAVGEAEDGARVWIIDDQIARVSDGLVFQKIAFEKDHAPNAGWVAKKYVCKD